MSNRKYSRDNSSDKDDTDEDIRFNHAMLLSESQSLCMEKSVVTKQKFRSAYGFKTYSVKQTISTAKSSSVNCSLRNNKTIHSDKECQDQGIKMQNTQTSRPADDKFEVKVPVNPTQSCGIITQDQTSNLLPESSKPEVKVPKPFITTDVILSKPMRIVSMKDLNDNLTTHDNIYIETESTMKHRNYIEQIDFCLNGTGGKNEDKLVSPSSDTSSNVCETMDTFTVTNLEKSNIWPALNTLDASLTKPHGNTSKEHTDIIENLNKQFSYSPRRFTESLLTIIEESFVESEQASEGLLKFLKKSEEVELFDDICAPKLVAFETSGPITDVPTKYDLHESSKDSTQYTSFKKLMSPKVHVKNYRSSLRLDVGRETPEIQRSKKINPIECSAEKKKYSKTPGLIKERGPTKISPAHRLRVGTASSIGNSPRRRKNFQKTPEIIVHMATPQFQRKTRRVSIQSWDDDEYLTAESDSEESKTNESEEPATIKCHEPSTIEIEEPVASSSRKLNMSSIANSHQEWVQAYEKASKYRSVIYRSMESYPKTKETNTKKLEKMWLRKLQQKRQQCLDLVGQYLEKGEEVDPSTSVCNSCKLTAEFVNTLRACSAYLTCGMNVRDACKSTARSRQYVSSSSVNIKKKNDLSPHSSVVHHGRIKSPGKSLGKKNIRVVSPGARYLSPFPKSCLQRQSLKGSKSPGVRSSPLRPVSELRKLFSPGKRAAGSRKSNKNLQVCSPRRNAALPEMSKTQQKFKHVVSPIAQYIKGN